MYESYTFRRLSKILNALKHEQKRKRTEEPAESGLAANYELWTATGRAAALHHLRTQLLDAHQQPAAHRLCMC